MVLPGTYSLSMTLFLMFVVNCAWVIFLAIRAGCRTVLNSWYTVSSLKFSSPSQHLMLDSSVASESFNAVVFFTLSSRLFDDSVMNSSYCPCEFLSNFSNVAQSSSPVNCRLLFGHRDDCLLCANCPTFSAFRCFRSFLRLRLSTHVPHLDFLASTALLLTSSSSALSLLVCLLLALLFCQL